MMPLHPHLGVILFLFGLVFFLAVASPTQAADSPRAALVQAQRGIDETDSRLFNAVVDVASVVDRASEVLIVAFREQAASGGDFGGGNMAVLLALAASAEDSGQIALLKPLLLSEVQGFVATGINGGYFAGKPDRSVKPPRNSLAGALRKMPVGRREIVPGKVHSQQGARARMSATFKDPGAGSLPLELVLEQQSQGWRVVEIANAKELFREATQRKRK